ncbi:coiled-coil domain-containing protein 121 [Gracilinanus agilis]|uniref:coiled-coil domain-containing protein 121 n=1 Tax=Gracilinanus agilis TaxID=191870 RepID=UPI001CFECC21|nr:coiled-coil domain-containing protein 121 [Gracilinanus agilis]
MQRELTIKAQVEQEMIQLNGELNKARAQRKQLVEDHCQIQNEIKPFLSDNHILMGYLPDPTKKTQVAPIKVWDQHTQQQEQIKHEQQQLVSSYESNILNLQEELLQLEMLQAHLKKKIQGLNARRIVQMTQEEQIKSLQMLEPLVQKEAEEQLRRAQGSLIAEWRALKHQLSDVELLLEKSKIGKYSRILEQAADKSIVSFTRHLQGENEHLHKEVKQLLQEAEEVEAQRIRLRRQKQQLQLEECCQESIKRGRKLKLPRANPYQKGQISPKTILAPLQSTKPRLNPS